MIGPPLPNSSADSMMFSSQATAPSTFLWWTTARQSVATLPISTHFRYFGPFACCACGATSGISEPSPSGSRIYRNTADTMPFWSWTRMEKTHPRAFWTSCTLLGSTMESQQSSVNEVDAPNQLSFAVFYHLYRHLHRALTGVRVRVGNFSILPFAYLSTLVAMSELWNHYAAAVFRSKLAFRMIPIPRGTRIAGSSKMNFVALVSHGLSAISVFGDIVGVRLLIASLLGRRLPDWALSSSSSSGSLPTAPYRDGRRMQPAR